jgi:hypothetical protein
MMPLTPRLDCLPPEQQAVWPALEAIPRRFVLYGDGDLRELPPEVQRVLVERAARFTEPDRLERISDSIAP